MEAEEAVGKEISAYFLNAIRLLCELATRQRVNHHAIQEQERSHRPP